jgi:hypothetical protein
MAKPAYILDFKLLQEMQPNPVCSSRCRQAEIGPQPRLALNIKYCFS